MHLLFFVILQFLATRNGLFFKHSGTSAAVSISCLNVAVGIFCESSLSLLSGANSQILAKKQDYNIGLAKKQDYNIGCAYKCDVSNNRLTYHWDSYLDSWCFKVFMPWKHV